MITALLLRLNYLSIVRSKVCSKTFSISSCNFAEGGNGSNKSNSNKKYSDTLLLPKTSFPLRIPQENRKEHELNVSNKSKFDHLYSLQRSWRRDQPEFILHDGPPYANGEPHIGHAVNKILKDVTNRYKLLRGYRINFRPGWDCHGLPIELKSSKKLGINSAVTDIRDSARNVANASIAKQKAAFEKWGIMGDWENPYKTFSPEYIKSQLQIFYKLYENGYLYRDLKPVYWSPSSQTALAEAELEYVPNHESVSAYISLDLNSSLSHLSSLLDFPIPGSYAENELSAPVHALIWTTTPWSLPSNRGVAYRESESYVVVAHSKNRERVFYLLAKSLMPSLSKTLNGAHLEIVGEFNGTKLKGLSYSHPWFPDTKHKFMPSEHVTMEKGTGLVHIAPAHGHDDFLLALANDLPTECFVDDEGNFDQSLEGLRGLPAMTGGNAFILKKLEDKGSLIKKEKYFHSYPYDWRTKKPVLIKASMQWFMDTNKLKEMATEAIEKINIYPKNIQNVMLTQVLKRPYWCISRQRVWGVPIPVVYHKETGLPHVSMELVSSLCEIVDEKKSIDDWWTLPLSQIMKEPEADSLYLKGRDIFDIWLDSGISWHILDDKVADLYVEGVDQFTGWFQSSLLTSLAIRGFSPFKSLFVHGFVVDEENKKMSKSIGNVVNPYSITDGLGVVDGKAFGVDVMRWWAAAHGSVDGSSSSLSQAYLKLADESIQKLRHVLRYLLCFTNERANDELGLDEVNYEELEYMDQYMLSLLSEFQKEITEKYDNFAYHRVLMRTLHFATVEVSQHYFSWIKDRLYCDRKDSQSRKSAIYVLNQIYLTFIKTLGPVLPFLTEESYSHYSLVEESLFKYLWFDKFDISWENEGVREIFEIVLDVSTSLNQILGKNDRRQVWAEIFCNQKNYKLLQVLHADACNSELSDILQVSGLSLEVGDQAKFLRQPYGTSHSSTGFSIGVSKTPLRQCQRCRRFCCPDGSVLCARCTGVLSQNSVPKSTQEVEESHVEMRS